MSRYNMHGLSNTYKLAEFSGCKMKSYIFFGRRINGAEFLPLPFHAMSFNEMLGKYPNASIAPSAVTCTQSRALSCSRYHSTNLLAGSVTANIIIAHLHNPV